MTWKARTIRITGLVAFAAVAAVTLRDKLPDPDDLLRALSNVHPWFVVLAVLAEAASLRHFALQQRRLLAGFGVGISIPRAMAVTMSRTAITVSVPGGSAVSAGYAFRQFRTAGASRQAAGSVTVLSGLLSAAALVLMYGVVLLLPGAGASLSSAHVAGVAGTGTTALFVLATLAAGFVVFAVDWRLSRTVYVPVEPVSEPEQVGRGVARLVAAGRRMLLDLRGLPPRSWLLSLLHATVNWATDLACLAAVVAALDIHVSLIRLATVYLTVQLVRQVPLSPGGIGVIEVALLAGLVSAGAGETPAAAAVLIYRLLSCWLIIPIGGLAYAALRRSPAPAVTTESPDQPEPTPESVPVPAPVAASAAAAASASTATATATSASAAAPAPKPLLRAAPLTIVVPSAGQPARQLTR